MSTEPIDTHAPAIAAEDVRAHLEAHEGPGVTGIAPLREGGWSSAWRYEVGNRRRVARFSRYREDFENDRWAMRWSSPVLPVPSIIAIDEAFGGHCARSEWVEGVPLDQLDGNELRTVLPALFGMLDALRDADPGETSGYGGWDSRGNAPFATWADFLLDVATDRPEARVRGWRERLAASPVGIDRFDEAFAALSALARQMPNDRHVIHSDLLNYNVLVGPGESAESGQPGTDPDAVDQDRHGVDPSNARVVTGVLDWGCGLMGDFVYDLAWFAWYWPWYPAWRGIDIVAEARRHHARIGLHVPDLDDRLRCYQLHIALGDQAYNAFMGRFDLADATASRAIALARTPR